MSSVRFALLSRGTTVLCDCRIVEGSYELLCQSVLDYVVSQEDKSQTKFSYATEEYHVYVYRSAQLYFMCVTALLSDRNIAFNTLFELERNLISAGLKERAQIALPYALRSSFSRIMYSTVTQSSSGDVLDRLEDKVGEVTDIMRNNITKAMNRGDTLDDLHTRSEALAISSADFRINATKLSRKLCLKNVKLWLILIVILAIIVLIIGIIVVAVLASKGTFKK